MPSPTSLQWLSLVGTIWLQTINGANSDFPVYSSQLKKLLSISQVQLNNLAVASDAGKLFGWISGVAAIHFPLWVVLMIGATLGLIGYGVQYLFLINKVSLSYWDVFALSLLSGNGICWINTVCYVVSIRNFHSDPRVAVGLSTSYVGLSAKVYTVLADAIFHPVPNQKASAYLLLNAVSPVLVTIVTAPFVRVIETDGRKTRSESGFIVMFVITLVIGLLAVVCSMGCVSKELPSAVHMVGLGLLLGAPLMVPAAARYRERLEERLPINKWVRRVHDSTVGKIEGEEGGEQAVVGKEVVINGVVGDQPVSVGEEQEEVGVGLMVRKIEFWLYFFGYMFGATVGLVFLNNLGQIAESRGLSRTSSLVSLASSFGFFGRFMPFLLDYFFSKYMASRPAFMAALMAPMAGAFFLLLDPSKLSLCISTAIIGACTGAVTSVAVSATPELFGTKNFSVNHNVVVANIPIGSFIFGYLAAFLYQRGGGGGSSSSDGRCMGAKCFNITFTLWGCICSLGTILCVILHMKTRRLNRLETN